MTCKECGAVIMGKYCVNCGKRAHTDAESEFLALQRTKRNYINERMRQNGYRNDYRIAADCAWRLAEQTYQEKCGQILTKRFCPPGAKFDIEREAECIARILDGVIYRSRVT